MKQWKTIEVFYSGLADKLNELEKQGAKIFWLHSPTNNAVIEIVYYIEIDS